MEKKKVETTVRTIFKIADGIPAAMLDTDFTAADEKEAIACPIV
ncbi:MAG: hypothetical protein ACI3W5_14160 [Faecousia sp.]